MGSRDARRPGFPSRVVALAASTGGPAALQSLLSTLPRPFPVPILVVQHLPASFTARFAAQLAQACLRPVSEVQPGLPLSPGSVIIAIGGQHMRVERDGKRVLAFPDDGPPENSCRPSADVLLRSLVQVFGRDTLAVMLTGVGIDGVAGCRAVHEAGGRVLAQDEASSSAWGMPGATVRAGVVDSVVPLHELPSEIARHCAVVEGSRKAKNR
jgi:two-component system, chemotaxis family, protein-glutamate methylesterase/glutaminase